MLKHCLIFILAILLIIISYNSLKEGVTFTRYDINNLVVQPWDAFCIQSNRLDRFNRSLCKGQKSILDNPPCTDIRYDKFTTIRR